ncbi:MAG: alginate export family protein [Myxococcota bacterium]
MRRWIGAVGLLLLLGAPSHAEPAETAEPADWERFLDNDWYEVSLDLRNRMELANFEGPTDLSRAFTSRLRAGIGNEPWFGLSGYAELESSWSWDNGAYWDVVTVPNREGLTPVADPRKTDLNQLFLKYENQDFLGVSAIAGRQRIILDDARFVGNVGWRQNEQTYDAALGRTSLGLEGLVASYGYLRKIHRIFGNKGPAANRDWSSDSHLLNVTWTGFEPLAVTAFAYLLDFKSDSPGNSANSWGLRAHGATKLSEDWKVAYAGSYAYQEDTGQNPVNYRADYVAADGSLGFAPLGTFGLGYELLGSDGGNARFVTPLATAHKFNGFADVFVNNGGPAGLQDFYVYLAPKLPWKLSGRLVYHHFWSDDGGTVLGEEYDFVLSRPINRWVSVLTKGALFESKTRTLNDGWRYWLEFTVAY